MVEFESMADRLYRVVRQAAKETGKQVRLDIVGGSIEIDRSVLERMAGPFEHLLRNAWPTASSRRERARPPARARPASIAVEVTQEGNEIGVEFRDDGAGLNRGADPWRARQVGLIPADARSSSPSWAT